MIELSLAELVLLVLGVATVSGFAHELWHDRRAAEDAICPVCLGPTEDNGTWEVDRR